MATAMIKQENPWDVSNIQEFLYYNCPECDTKERDSEVFIQHALDNHELSKSYLNNPHDQDDITESHSVKSETDFSDSEFKESLINDASSLPDSKLPTILDFFSINTKQPMTLQTQDNVEDNSDRSSFHKEQLKSGKPYDVRYIDPQSIHDAKKSI